jgi:glycosyltransferase involved in cell wall biosynthesis
VIETDSSGSKLPLVHFLISHSHHGGAQELWANLAQGFMDRGFGVDLLALYPDGAGEQVTPAGLDWTYILPRRPGGPGAVASLMKGLVRKLRSDRPQCVFTALPAANVLVPAAAQIAGTGTRVVTTHHTPSQTYQKALDRLDGLTGCLRSVQNIVCVSDAVATSLSSKPALYRSKLKTIRNAVPPAIEELLAQLSSRRERNGFKQDTIVCSGRLAPQKNFEVVIRAMARLPGVKLELVGAGPEEAWLKKLTEECGVGSQVSFLGQKSREDTLSIVAEGAVFVQMSRFEGNSLSLIEAAKLGLPLVVSDAPEQREGVTSSSGRCCGLVLPMHDHVTLADALTRVLKDDVAYADLASASKHLGEEIQFSKLIGAYSVLTGSSPFAASRQLVDSPTGSDGAGSAAEFATGHRLHFAPTEA